MQPCWCRAGRIRYWRARAKASPARDRRHDRRSRRGRSRMREDWAPRLARLCGLTRPCLLPVLISTVDAIDQAGKAVRYALIDHVIVHGAQLLPETSLGLAAQFGRF